MARADGARARRAMALPARMLRDRGLGRASAVVAVALIGTGCTPMDNVMVSIFGRSMRDQSSFSAYENTRPPAVGSVPFASGNFPSGPGVVNLGQPEGVAMPAPITVNDLASAEVAAMVSPVERTPASLARGEQVFNRTCSPCHGETGAGDGAVSQAAPLFSRSLLLPTALELPDGYIYSMIRIGRGLMPAYGHQVSHFDRWHVVNYVRQLQGL
ncbi:MAG: cytochrome c [Gemmatimonadetes bacterium]|nr:cytochrome c [Gemmatimonadota bacterium]